MASIVIEKTGSRRIDFIHPTGDRRSIRLGRVDKRGAERFCGMVETLVGAILTGQALPPAEVVEWAEALPATMRGKLVRAGLIVDDGDTAPKTLGWLLDEFAASLAVKASTRVQYGVTLDDLAEHFGRDLLLSDLGPLGAERWKRSMQDRKMAPATVARRVKVARTLFKCAVKWKAVAENPFADVKAGGQSNPDRMRFVTREETAALLSVCPSVEWRLIVALSRYGGLRCPSEVGGLRWGDVLWDERKMRVRSPKTEVHGKGSRVVPIFPELYPVLLEAWAAAEPGAELVAPGAACAAVNLRTHMLRLVERAALEPWPKLFQNLRMSRQTELARTHPLHVVCAWMGNTPAVAQAHYLKVTEDDFARAVGEAPGEAQQNPQHTLRESGGLEGTGEDTPDPGNAENRREMAVFGGEREGGENLPMTPRGFEPL